MSESKILEFCPEASGLGNWEIFLEQLVSLAYSKPDATAGNFPIPKFPNMKEQLIEAWQTSNKMNLLFIDEVSDEGMQKTLSTRGGRTIYEQLVHVHNVRMTWLEVVAKEIFKKYKAIDKNAPYNKKLLRKSFEKSADAITEFINQSWDQGGKVKSFKKGLVSFVAYFIAHEAHHRGGAMLTLKQSGVKVSDKLKWGLWEWDK